jgi:hypothetical protein
MLRVVRRVRSVPSKQGPIYTESVVNLVGPRRHPQDFQHKPPSCDAGEGKLGHKLGTIWAQTTFFIL